MTSPDTAPDTAPDAGPAIVPAAKITAHDLEAAVQRRYEPSDYHVEREVTLDGRRIDLVAFALWPSKQHRVVGFEVKVSRGDWLRELADFQKAERWASVVDAFYIVTPPKLVRHDELPAGWGLLELCGSRLMTRAHPAPRTPGTTMPREVAARIVARVTQRDRAAERTAEFRAREELRREISEQLAKEHERSREAERSELAELREERRALCLALGIGPYEWRAHEKVLAAAVAFHQAQHEGVGALRARLEQMATALGHHVDRIRAAAEALPAPDTPAVTLSEARERRAAA